MQDNALIYTAKKVKQQFEDNSINTSDWSPYSPDLNPIENAQAALKTKVAEMFPEVWTAKGKTEQDRKNMEEALKKAWLAFPKELFEELVQSMLRRINACILARGWYTKY